MLDVVWLGKLSISLSTQNNCWGGGRVKLLLSNDELPMFQILKAKEKPSFTWLRSSRAEVAVILVSSDVLSAYRGGACMAECITGGVQVQIHA